MQTIVGRKKEQADLQRLYNNNTAELVALYGRRRVGKTFLVREFFKGKFAFYHTGVSPIEISGNKLLKRQLEEFHFSLRQYGFKGSSCPTSWAEAFHQLQQLLSSKSQEDRMVVFIDELPWMDTQRSGFVTAFEHFWNGWGAGQSNLLCIVCGSAISWMNDKLLNNKGGLYDRVTYEIRLLPFCLNECEAYYEAKGVVLDRYDVAQSYMAIGGIPYYMNYFQPGLSLSQNIDQTFFSKTARLRNEFDRLFASIFSNSEESITIVRLLATRRFGFTRNEITQKTGLPSGGTLTKILQSLIISDFVDSYTPLNHTSEKYYRLVDNFCLFYLHFLDGKNINDENFWQNSFLSPTVTTWKGLAFENVCFCHIPQIKKALGIAGVQTDVSSLIIQGDKGANGMQIDMVVKRADRVVNLCEIKFYQQEYRIEKTYEEKLRQRVEVVRELTRNKLNIHLTFISTFGLAYNEYSSRIQKSIMLDDLFES